MAYDLMDEVEAHKAQLRNAKRADRDHPKMVAFSNAMGNRKKAGVLEPYYIGQGLKGKFHQDLFPRIGDVELGSVFRGPTMFGRVR